MRNANMPAMPHDIIFGKWYPADYENTGLTKREHFAGVAMQALLANAAIIDLRDLLANDANACLSADDCASYAIEYSNALLKALEKDHG